MTRLTLTIEDERTLRAYAVRLDVEDGEDAYHDAVEAVLSRPPVDPVENVAGYLCVAIKRALWDIKRARRLDRERSADYLQDSPPPSFLNLTLGRQQKTHCRQGHPLTETNLHYSGPRRTCLLCYRIGNARHQSNKRQRDKGAA